MRRYMLATAIVGSLAATMESASTPIPATATFRDFLSDRIRSDWYPPPGPQYQDGVDCVKSQVSGNGYFLRTASYDYYPCGVGYIRRLTVDFSDQVALAAGVNCSTPVTDAYGGTQTLDICGSNLIPDARFIAGSLFSKASGNGTPVMLVLNLFPDFRHNEFTLEFEQNQPITVLSPTSRTLTGSTLSIADLYRTSGTNKKTLLGQYRMPFQVTVQE